MAGVLQEAGDAESRARTRSQVYVEYFTIPYTSTFIRLSHLYQEFYVHCIIIMNDEGMASMGKRGWRGWLICIRVKAGEQGWVLSCTSCVFYLYFSFLL